MINLTSPIVGGLVKVVLDTNALLAPFSRGIWLEDELQRVLGGVEIYVPSSVLDELRRLSAGMPEARAALLLASRYRTVEVSGRGDEGVLEAASRLGAVLVTNDAGLRAEARRRGIRVAFLRTMSRLEVEG